MTNPLPDYSALVEAAVASYWDVRQTQAQASLAQGVVQQGLRGEATGGQHMNELAGLIVRVFMDAGIPAQLIDVRKRPIAGYFRRDKSWDLVIMVADRVVAIIELKSMGPNDPGKNYNNRTDEALGQAVDVWKAVERGIIDSPTRPWLGYFMLLEDNAAFTRPVVTRSTVWAPDPTFSDSSYEDRYAVFFDRMVRERLLDSACVALGNRETGQVRHPTVQVSFQAFAAAIHGRCLQFMATNPDLDWDAS